MDNALQIIPLTTWKMPEVAAVQRIYDQTFEDDERMPFEALWDWMTHSTDNFCPQPWALMRAGQVAGLSFFGYLPPENFGYMAYLAIRPDLRQQGHGQWLLAQTLTGIKELAQAAGQTSPRLAFWEVRTLADAPTVEEKARRAARIRFYERQGAQCLPMAYTCPPIAPGLPEVPYTLMAYTYLPPLPLQRVEVMALALAGLIKINDVAPESDYVQAALKSIEDYQPSTSLQTR